MAWILYYLSLLPLFCFIAIKYFEPCSFIWLYRRWFCCLNCEHYAFMISIFCIITGLFLLSQLAFKTKQNYHIAGTKIIEKPQSLNHEMIGVLSSVVLPFLTVNFTTVRECVASIFVIALIGLISTRSNLYYKNPILALFKLKIFSVTIEHRDFKEPKQFDVICFNQLQVKDSLYLKKIADGVFYAKKV